jgi:uncharacterized protein (TIGR00369 family)
LENTLPVRLNQALTHVTTENRTFDSERHGHSHCLLCGDQNPWSQRLNFSVAEDGSVSAEFQARPELQGYDGILHGGVICALLDAAMTHCLFHRGISAVTADIQVRFLEPVPCNAKIILCARAESITPLLFRMKSELLVDEGKMAWAKAKFVRRKMEP